GDLAAGVAKLTCLRQACRVKDAAPRRKQPPADSHTDLRPLAHRAARTGSSIKEGVLSPWGTVLGAMRISVSPSLASTGWPLLVLRARRGKLLLVTSTSMR